MTFLPIVDRELRVRARQKSTHRVRLIGAALASALVTFMPLADAFGRGAGKFGGSVFIAVAWLAFLYALLEGARNTADCLSEEKRAGTLGLLFLTDLKGYDVVLGKLIATSLNWFFLISASCLLPRAWQDRPVMAGNPWFQRFRSRKSSLPPEARRRVQDRQMTPNPVLWLAVRHGGLQPYLWAGVAILASAAIAAWLVSRGAAPVLFGILFVAWGVHLLLTIVVASQACLCFAQARDAGALELLLCTPVTVNQIVDGHIQALKQRFLGPALALAGVELLIVIGQMLLVATRDKLSLVLLPIGAGALIYVFLTDLGAAGCFGLWMGLRSKNSGQALTRTVLLVLIAPMILSVVCWFSFGWIIVLFKNVVFITYAMDQLRRNFRAQVTQRFAAGQAAALQPVRLTAIGPGERPPVIKD